MGSCIIDLPVKFLLFMLLTFIEAKKSKFLINYYTTVYYRIRNLAS